MLSPTSDEEKERLLKNEPTIEQVGLAGSELGHKWDVYLPQRLGFEEDHQKSSCFLQLPGRP